jgi:hypothetical protein
VTLDEGDDDPAVLWAHLAAKRVGLFDAVEDGEVHTAYGVAPAAHGRPREALSSLEKGVFLRRIWGQKLDLIDGLIAPASHVEDPERATALFDEAQALVARCVNPGVLPVRLAAARRGATVKPGAASDARSDRELTVLKHLADGLTEREIAAALYLSFIPASGQVFWGSALANIHPGPDDTHVDYGNERRAPLLFISGSTDHLMPPAIQASNAKHYNDAVLTEVKVFEGPHLLPAWPGWEEVADYAVDWALEKAVTPVA